MASDAPKSKSLYTLKLEAASAQVLRKILAEKGWELKEVEYALFGFKGPTVQVVYYTSGKLVVQGKGTEAFVRDILEPQVTGVALLGYDEIHHPDWFELHAGCDEAGKGDVFGPLVTAAVVADKTAIDKWIEAGIKDSKRIGDKEALRLDKLIRATSNVAVKTASCSMARYNELMSKPTSNLNRLLAWLHAKSLGEALKLKSAPWGLLDQFAKRDSVDHYLAMPSFELRRRTKAESDPVVAAASIVARASYLKAMKTLSDAIGEELPKGASNQTQFFFKDLRERIGRDEMANYAKMHFKLRAIGEGPKDE